MSGGVVLYAAQSNAQIDAEIVKKGGFRTETSYSATAQNLGTIRKKHFDFARSGRFLHLTKTKRRMIDQGPQFI